MEIHTDFPANAANYKKGRRGIKYIVVHYTANNGDTARGNAVYFAKNTVGTSAHFFVDENGVYKSVPEKDTAWHCGGKIVSDRGHTFFGKCTNSCSIGVELCSRKNKSGYYFVNRTMKNAAVLIAELMKRYGVPIENVIRHFDVTGKNCPAPFVENALWERFKDMLKEGEEMTAEEKERLVRLESAVAELKKEHIYHYVNELPTWARPTVQKLLDKCFFKGESDADLNLPESLLRMMVINDRAGVYDR